jgi:hypothetical protein
MVDLIRYDAELTDLWQRRSDLDESEWHKLYALVWKILISFRPSELAGLPDEREEYVQAFFERKVFRLDAAADGRGVHSTALREYYRRFLRDRLDEIKHERTMFIASDGEEEGGCCGMADAADGGADTPLHELADAGLALADVVARTDAWLARMEAWVTPYLALHYCADVETSEPLVHLAQRLGVASYHHKAKKLGFVWSPKQADSGASFGRDTLLGRFVEKDLGIPVTAKNSSLVLSAFKILCHQALLRSDQMELAL